VGLSAGAFIEKNKMASANAWLVLLQITMPDDTVFRVCANNEDVTWPVTAGNVYSAFPFEVDEIGDSSKGEVPSFSIKVSNITRTLIPYLEDQDGLIDSTIKLYIVNSINATTDALGAGVNNNSPEIELDYDVTDSNYDAQWVYFTLGALNPYNRRFPRNKVWKNICSYKEFGGDRCQYAGAETTCDRSLATCRDTMNNSINFGGKPGVGTKGVYV